MGCDAIGLVKKDIKVYDLLQYIKENVDANATVDNQMTCDTRSNYIDFKYKDESRHMHVFADCTDYQHDTHYMEKTTCFSLGLSGEAPEAVLKPMVEYFGGFYIPNDCADGCFFFPFNDELLKKYPLEKAILDKLADEKDWETKIKIMEFVKSNLTFVSELNEMYG